MLHQAELKKLPELTFPRRQLGNLLMTRSQHGDFAEYHEKFHPGQATLECPCGRQKSPTHLSYCRKVAGHLRVRLALDPKTAIACRHHGHGRSHGGGGSGGCRRRSCIGRSRCWSGAWRICCGNGGKHRMGSRESGQDGCCCCWSINGSFGGSSG